MRFYSYNYLLEQIARFDWWGAALTIFLIICLIFTMYKYHQGQKETKFRELAIILGLGIVVMISIKISQYRVTQINDNMYEVKNTESGLYAYWKMNEVKNNKIPDVSGNNRDLILRGQANKNGRLTIQLHEEEKGVKITE